MPWQPGQRRAALALEAPYEDVPAHLQAGLWAWVEEHCENRAVMYAVGVHLRLALPDARQDLYAARERFAVIVPQQPLLILDSIEFLLSIPRVVARDVISDLNVMLDLGNSIYRVNNDRDGLDLRVLPEVRDEVQAVVDAATGSPGEHLATAWSKAYGRTPDPVASYSEAIKAVEAAGAPVISPQNAKATLGTMIRDIASKPSKWEVAIINRDDSGVERVLGLMRLLWDGQTSRHGGVAPTVPETPEAAQGAVHIAATLVQFFISGTVTAR